MIRLRFIRRLGLLAGAAVAPVAGCHHAAPAPVRWAEARGGTDFAFVVGEVRSNRRDFPLDATRVRLLDANGTPRDSASADAAGAFVLGPLPPGSYHLQARAIVHRPFGQTLVLRAGVVDTVRVRLTYDDTGAIVDCIGPERADGTRGFGSQFCRR